MRNDFETNYLMHHGILGMKWGIRNYQNPDGSLTEAGRQRYGVGPGREIGEIHTKKGVKKREKDLKKAIKKNEKKRGKEYSKIANNPENFLGLNKKHGKKIEEYSENIRKGEEELKRLKILLDDIDKDQKEYKDAYSEWNKAYDKWEKNTDTSQTKKLAQIEKEASNKEYEANEKLRSKGYTDDEIIKLMQEVLDKDYKKKKK